MILSMRREDIYGKRDRKVPHARENGTYMEKEIEKSRMPEKMGRIWKKR